MLQHASDPRQSAAPCGVARGCECGCPAGPQQTTPLIRRYYYHQAVCDLVAYVLLQYLRPHTLNLVTLAHSHSRNSTINHDSSLSCRQICSLIVCFISYCTVSWDCMTCCVQRGLQLQAAHATRMPLRIAGGEGGVVARKSNSRSGNTPGECPGARPASSRVARKVFKALKSGRPASQPG